MPTKTIPTNVIGTLYTCPSLSDITIGTTTAGTSSEIYTEAKANITSHPHAVWTQDRSMTMSGTCTFTPSEFHPEWNCKPKGLQGDVPGSTFFMISTDPTIVNIDVIVPEKVVEVTIFDGVTYVYKQVCREPDEFNFKFALALAWAKYINETHEFDYTLGGIEATACEYMWKYAAPLKEFDRAIKAYNKWFKEQTKKEAEEAERQAIIERRRAKNKKRKEKMRARKKQEEISTIAEAIKLAKE